MDNAHDKISLTSLRYLLARAEEDVHSIEREIIRTSSNEYRELCYRDLESATNCMHKLMREIAERTCECGGELHHGKCMNGGDITICGSCGDLS